MFFLTASKKRRAAMTRSHAIDDPMTCAGVCIEWAEREHRQWFWRCTRDHQLLRRDPCSGGISEAPPSSATLS
jgi:hypothetical protein